MVGSVVSRRTVRWPLRWALLPSGITAVKGIIPLLVRNRLNHFDSIDFLVDSGANVTTIAVTDARNARIPFPAQSINLTVRTAAGNLRQRVHPGTLSVRVAAFPSRQFLWPCHFVEHSGAGPRAVLGLAGVLRDLRLIFDGTYSLEAPHGWLVLEEPL
jgi:hypothetical protein